MQGSATQYLSVLLEPYYLLRSLRSASKLLYNCPHLVLEYTDIILFGLCTKTSEFTANAEDMSF